MTQRQLAETIGISDRTVSKWETGRGFPEVSLIQPLCQVLDIDVNELLSGQSLTPETYHQKAEVYIMNLLNEKEENKKKYVWAWSVFALTIVTVIALALVTKDFEFRNARIFGTLLVYILLFTFAGISIMLALYLDSEIYQCRHCQMRFKPKFKDYFIPPLHILFRERNIQRTFATPWHRPLMCPNCQQLDHCYRVWTRFETKEEQDDDL